MRLACGVRGDVGFPQPCAHSLLSALCRAATTPSSPWGSSQAQQGRDKTEQAGGEEQDPSSAPTCAPSARLLGEGQAGHPDPTTPALVMLIPQPTPSLFLAIFNLLLLTTRQEKEDGVKRGRKPRGERSVAQLQQPGVCLGTDPPGAGTPPQTLGLGAQHTPPTEKSSLLPLRP